MKKIIFLALFFVISSSIFAQATEKVLLNKNEEAVAKLLEAKPNGWVKKGTLTFLANQATFNNWLAGGQSNFSGNMGINYDFNYKKDNKRSLGLIAEEVAQVYPELVEYENGQPLGVNYSKLTSVLISAVNELAAELAELKKQLNK